MNFDPKRFWGNVDKSGNIPEHVPNLGPCWEWIGGTFQRSGYGRIKVDGRARLAHRLLFVVTCNLDYDTPLLVCHKCDNRSCVRPNHMFLGTSKDNSQDMSKKGRAASGDNNGSRLYPERLRRGERVNTCKLSTKDVLNIRDRYKNGETTRSLANEYSMQYSSIRRIILKVSWKHI